MPDPDVKFIDASKWIQLEWYNSGGTRAKRVLQSPDGNEWYFKCSEKKPAKENNPEKYYKYEFWSEIIAYQLGKQLGLNVLRYDVAIHDGAIGCISPLMINREEEQLVEVGRYMTSLSPGFLPENNSTRIEYTFQLLEETLIEFGLTGYWSFFFSTMLFDTIIGNTDRHQENWAFITKSTYVTESIDNLNIVSTAPVYDNGSSLARELMDERIDKLLSNKVALDKYIANGAAEVHWERKKVSHFQLIENLLNSSYIEEVKIAAKFIHLWDEQNVAKIINTIDKELPDYWHSYCIPHQRKTLIIKLLTLRSQKLRELINDRF